MSDPTSDPTSDPGRFDAIVRCSRGGLFHTLWVPFVSFRAVRVGTRRFQRCPVHGRAEWVERVEPGGLTSAQLAEAARYPAGRIP